MGSTLEDAADGIDDRKTQDTGHALSTNSAVILVFNICVEFCDSREALERIAWAADSSWDVGVEPIN